MYLFRRSPKFISYNLYVYCINNPINRKDNGGLFSFTLAVGIIGGIIGGVTQVLSNIASGNQWSDGLIGAVLGGALYNVITVVSGGNTVLAAYGSVFVESLANEVVDHVVNRSFTKESVTESIVKIAADTAINGTLMFSTGRQAESIVHINYKSWIKPRKIVSCFTGNYAKKVMQQTLTQALLTTSEKRMINRFMIA